VKLNTYMYRAEETYLNTIKVEIVYNEHQDQAEFARYNRYRYIYIRAHTKTFYYGI